MARLWLGVDLAATGGDARRARELVAAARSTLAKLDPDALRAADVWIRKHPK